MTNDKNAPKGSMPPQPRSPQEVGQGARGAGPEQRKVDGEVIRQGSPGDKPTEQDRKTPNAPHDEQNRNRGEQNRGEQNRGEQNRGDQNRGEQNRGDQNRGESNRGTMNPSDAERGGAERPQGNRDDARRDDARRNQGAEGKHNPTDKDQSAVE